MTDKKRNLIIRTLTGIVFVAILVGGILWSWMSFTVLFMLITALSIKELCDIINQKEDVQVNTMICTVAGTYLFGAISGFCSQLTSSAVFIPYLLSIVYLLVSELYQDRQYALNNWAFTMFSQMYIALPFGTLNALAFQNDPTSSIGVVYQSILPLSVFLFLWSSDSGAYCFGSLFGKRKLFPSISPNKSWEGSVGGGIIALAVSQILASYYPILSRMEWLGFALIVVIFGTWGDLVESLLKRQLGIKDSGHILPGHGGMLDRFDSSLLAIPASVIYIYTLTLF